MGNRRHRKEKDSRQEVEINEREYRCKKGERRQERRGTQGVLVTSHLYQRTAQMQPRSKETKQGGRDSITGTCTERTFIQKHIKRT